MHIVTKGYADLNIEPEQIVKLFCRAMWLRQAEKNLDAALTPEHVRTQVASVKHARASLDELIEEINNAQ